MNTYGYPPHTYEDWVAQRPRQPFDFAAAAEEIRAHQDTAMELEYRRIVQEALARRDAEIQREMVEYYRRAYALEPEPFQDAFMRFMDKEEKPAESVLAQHFI